MWWLSCRQYSFRVEKKPWWQSVQRILLWFRWLNQRVLYKIWRQEHRKNNAKVKTTIFRLISNHMYNSWCLTLAHKTFAALKSEESCYAKVKMSYHRYNPCLKLIKTNFSRCFAMFLLSSSIFICFPCSKYLHRGTLSTLSKPMMWYGFQLITQPSYMMLIIESFVYKWKHVWPNLEINEITSRFARCHIWLE